MEKSFISQLTILFAMSLGKFKLIRRVHANNFTSEVRLIYAVFKSKLKKTNFKLDLIVKVDGVKYKLIDFESLVIVSPNFEPEQQKYLVLKEDYVFVDVGAHIGKYALSNAKIVGAKGKIIAIEADSDTFQALKKGVEENGFSNVIPLNYAAYNKEGEIDFYSAPSGGVNNENKTYGKGFSSTKYLNGRAKTSVMAKRIDTIVHDLNLNRVDYIKIDAEGSEVEVLEGARETILAFKPILIIESITTQTQMKTFFESVDYLVEEVSKYYFYAHPVY